MESIRSPVLRALNFKNICEKKTIYIGKNELIVGERGPYPKAVSTFPELTCHTVDDLQILNSRAMTRYAVSDEDIEIYKNEIIPYWQGRTLRERVFSQVPTRVAGGLCRRYVHRIYGATRSRAYSPGWDHL